MSPFTRFSAKAKAHLFGPFSLNNIAFSCGCHCPEGRNSQLFPCKLGSELEGVFTIALLYKHLFNTKLKIYIRILHNSHQIESQRILAICGHLMNWGKTDKILEQNSNHGCYPATLQHTSVIHSAFSAKKRDNNNN